MEWQNKNETKDIREDRNMIKGIIFFFFCIIYYKHSHSDLIFS
jgi:hypothetical protein